jgi:hypothetical protein
MIPTAIPFAPKYSDISVDEKQRRSGIAEPEKKAGLLLP